MPCCEGVASSRQYVTNETIILATSYGRVRHFMTPLHKTSGTMVFTNLVEASHGRPASAEPAVLTGCPWHDVKTKLREVGLRPTRQRMALGWILFGKGDRHMTAEMLYEEATKAKVPVSLATV